MKKSLLLLLTIPFMLCGCGEDEQTNAPLKPEEDPIVDPTGKTLTSISIVSGPTKTEYAVGDYFDPTGMVVQALYSDSSTEVITDYNYPTDKLTKNDKTITISYQNLTVSLTISIKDTIDEDEYTATVMFCGSTFASKFSTGTNFDNAGKFDELLEYIDEQLEYYDLINQITCTKCATRKVDSDTYLQIGTGSAKNGFNEGVFNWSCKEKIYRIELTAFNYSNPYQDWQTGKTIPNVDNMGHLILDDLDTSFEIPEDAEPVTKTIVKEYPDGANGFRLHSTGGRILVSQMKITWRG